MTPESYIEKLTEEADKIRQDIRDDQKHIDLLQSSIKVKKDTLKVVEKGIEAFKLQSQWKA